METVAVVGASGFIGSAVRAALLGAVEVRALAAPRLQAAGVTLDGVRRQALSHPAVAALAEQLAGCSVVVNCAGLAVPSSPLDPALVGANALLPSVLQQASAAAGVRRFVQVSSAAVQGRRVLSDSAATDPQTPYALTKAWGEQLVLAAPMDVVVLRPTSVHAAQRQVTRTIARLARSRMSCVAGDGSRPTPQVHVDNVAAAVAHVADLDLTPPRIVLQPAEGWTTKSFLTLMGLGRAPRSVPELLARGAVAGATAAGRWRSGLAAQGRRLELVLMGQDQQPGWLDRSGFVAPAGPEAWERLARSID